MCTGLALGSAGDDPTASGQLQEPKKVALTKISYDEQRERGLGSWGAIESLKLEMRTGLGGGEEGAMETQQKHNENLKFKSRGLKYDKLFASSEEKQTNTQRKGPNPPCCTGAQWVAGGAEGGEKIPNLTPAAEAQTRKQQKTTDKEREGGKGAEKKKI